MLMDIYSHLCLTDVSIKTALINTGLRPSMRTNIVSDILIDVRVLATSDKCRPGTRNAARSLAPVLQAQK